jgi:hypothetical protein
MPGGEIPRAGTPQRRGRPRGTRPRLADRGAGGREVGSDDAVWRLIEWSNDGRDGWSIGCASGEGGGGGESRR